MSKYIFSLGLIFLATTVSASEGVYSGIQWGIYDYQEEAPFDGAPSLSTEAVTLGFLLGYKINDYIGFEFRAGSQPGDNKEELNVLGNEIELEFRLKHYFSAYIRPEYRYKYAIIYGLLGYGQISAEAEIPELNSSVESKGNGVTYGAGIGFTNSDNIVLAVEYVNLYDDSGVTFDGINLSFTFPL